jgi:hypothetical protein
MNLAVNTEDDLLMPDTPRAGLCAGPSAINLKQLFLRLHPENDPTSRSLEIDEDDLHSIPIVMDSPRLMPERLRLFSIMTSTASYYESPMPLLSPLLALPVPSSPSSERSPSITQSVNDSYYEDSSDYSEEGDSTLLSPLNSAHVRIMPLARFLTDTISDEDLYSSIDSTERHEFNLEDPTESEGRSEVIRNFYATILSQNISILRTKQHTYQAALQPLSTSCAICLEDFCEGDTVKTLPCQHVFHDDHVTAWFARSLTCPLCKARVLHS